MSEPSKDLLEKVEHLIPLANEEGKRSKLEGGYNTRVLNTLISMRQLLSGEISGDYKEKAITDVNE
jgi:hypothetical protein